MPYPPLSEPETAAEMSVVDALHAAQAQLTSPNETINLLPAYDQVERSPEHSAQLIGSYAGPLNVPFEGEGWFPAPEGSNSFGRRYIQTRAGGVSFLLQVRCVLRHDTTIARFAESQAPHESLGKRLDAISVN